jgi:vacuolar-type H+-ATPase subunit E/Vma4
MPLTEIRKKIEEESKKSTKSIEQETQKERDAILSDAKEKVKEIMKNADQETSQELNRLMMEQSASTDLLAREVELTARESALDDEINEVRAELIKAIRANTNLYKKIFSNAIKSIESIGPARQFTIITNKKDSALVGKTDARVEYQNISSGLIIQSQDKNISIDATLENLVDSKREEIKSVLLDSMFKPRSESKKASVPKIQKQTKKSAKPAKVKKVKKKR